MYIVAERRNKAEELKRQSNLYLTIIMRYKDYIEQEENMSVAMLPMLVTPEDPAILAFAEDIKAGFGNYSFESNFVAAATRAHEFVTNKITTVSLPVQFWLKPSETLAARAGDVLDKATLLCSVMIALGNLSTKIIAVSNDSSMRTGVYCEFAGGLLYFDLQNGIRTFSSKEELEKEIGVSKGSEVTAYEFNNTMYNDLL
ncbi:MAG: hypothetical protein QXT43_00045 [Candidatus Micrarchaeaceae archaeon]